MHIAPLILEVPLASRSQPNAVPGLTKLFSRAATEFSLYNLCPVAIFSRCVPTQSFRGYENCGRRTEVCRRLKPAGACPRETHRDVR
ncbi:hypothetical protein SBA4_180046 [Candidatus Sulfopaludibacter sp. SbA4]|nr:hypothetical protein SBA4_180046 [Candidatus Sulfopaludibacter sp. SbA4]